MTNTVKYTETSFFDSTAVDEAFYDEKNQTLTLALYGGVFYRYNNVPVDVYQGLLNAPSAGKYYHETIQTFGPAERLGSRGQLLFEDETDYHDYDDDEEYSSDEAFYDDDWDNYVDATPLVAILEQPRIANPVPTPQLSLKVNDPLAATVDTFSGVKKHDVLYSVVGHEQEYLFETQTTTIDNALLKLHALGETLGLVFKVKLVSVHYDE